MDDFFRKLEDPVYFDKFVTEFFGGVPAEMAPILECTPEVAPSRISYAHREYVQNVGRFSLYLDSADPDHYKRAGALLHALYQSKIIVDVGFVSELDDLEVGMGAVHVHRGDIDGYLEFARFYQEYHNEMIAFILCFQCCAAYEPKAQQYDYDYLLTVCVYMKKNANLSMESFFILFKSLFH